MVYPISCCLVHTASWKIPDINGGFLNGKIIDLFTQDFFLPPCYRIGKSFKSFFLDMFHHCEPNIYLVSHIPGIPILSHRTRSMTTPWDPWVVSGRRLTACGDWVVGPRRFCPTATWHRNHRSRRWKLKWLWVKTLHPKWYTFCHSWYCWMVIPPVHSQVLTHPQMFFWFDYQWKRLRHGWDQRLKPI